ncbi:GntR family transcriptional regulator [Blastococcus sp. SYSU D00820]
MNKQERTYTILRDRIHAGDYQPLDRLNIDALARELGVSPIPVREALRRLEAEGWVQFRPNAGAVVAPVDATSWEQAMVALAVLEGAASGQAQPRLRKTDLTRLRRLAEQMEQAAVAGDALRFGTLNRRFHEAIVGRCANEVLLDLLKQTHRRLDQVRRTMFVYLPERSRAALAEHQHLIGLLETGDPQQVEEYARWHKLQTVQAYQAIHQAASRADERPVRRAGSRAAGRG